MQKPTIFFSHSSRDKDYISVLRKRILKVTAKTIEIFQSSDGESIPFGNNWVHKIEENLDKAKIMLVFVSPQSINSNWIHFESGFAYAKGVKVIPIGIKGIDVGKLSPPINLLQGFNIMSEAGMNNIVTVINREFNCDFLEDFESQDYAELSLHDETAAVIIPSSVDYFQFDFPAKISLGRSSEVLISEKPLEAIGQCLDKLGIEFGYSAEKKIYSNGVVIEHKPPSNGEQPPTLGPVNLKMDPYRFSTSKEVVEGMCNALYGENQLTKFWCRVFFNEGTILETTEFKVSARLHKIGLSMSKLNASFFTYKGLDFVLKRDINSHQKMVPVKNHIHVVFDPKNLVPSEILELISLMYDAKVICQQKE